MTYFAVETQTFENMSSKAKQKVSVNYIMTKSVSWFWMCLLFKDSSLLLQTDRNHIFFCGKVLFSLGVRLAVAYITTAQIWKSLHIVAAIAVAVLTREREISTCPDHIPALALNSTHLLCKLESTPRSLSAKTPINGRINPGDGTVWRHDLVIQTHCETAWGIPGIQRVSLELLYTEAP